MFIAAAWAVVDEACFWLFVAYLFDRRAVVGALASPGFRRAGLFRFGRAVIVFLCTPSAASCRGAAL